MPKQEIITVVLMTQQSLFAVLFLVPFSLLLPNTHCHVHVTFMPSTRTLHTGCSQLPSP